MTENNDPLKWNRTLESWENYRFDVDDTPGNTNASGTRSHRYCVRDKANGSCHRFGFWFQVLDFICKD